jgi:hypothetical protein
MQERDLKEFVELSHLTARDKRGSGNIAAKPDRGWEKMKFNSPSLRNLEFWPMLAAVTVLGIRDVPRRLLLIVDGSKIPSPVNSPEIRTPSTELRLR